MVVGDGQVSGVTVGLLQHELESVLFTAVKRTRSCATVDRSLYRHCKCTVRRRSEGKCSLGLGGRECICCAEYRSYASRGRGPKHGLVGLNFGQFRSL